MDPMKHEVLVHDSGTLVTKPFRFHEAHVEWVWKDAMTEKYPSSFEEAHAK